MKTFTRMKKTINTLLLMILLGNSAWGQVLVNKGFEAACANTSNSFYLGCIPNWISTSGTPDTQSAFGAAYQGSKYAHCYAKWDGGCVHPQLSEGIAVNYAFQNGATYKITYAIKVGTGINLATQSLDLNWMLTNGLVNQGAMGACIPSEYTPNIPAGSQSLPTPSYNSTSWTLNQQTFTVNGNFNQMWLRCNVNSTVLNALGSCNILIDNVIIEKICIPTPTITSASSFCLGSPLTFTGSATNCTVTNNVWTLVECTSTGGAVTGSVEWWSPWATGAPGTLTIPPVTSGGPTIACGKYYRIKLAVQNAYTTWSETTKIIYINCPPSFKLKGSTSTICTGDAALLNATMNVGSNSIYYLTWTPISPAGPAIYNGSLAGVSVSPSVTTTYQANVTDLMTGCSSTMQWTVNVVKNDPTFSLYINTLPASYFTVALTANDPNGYSNSGFYYSLKIEELNSTGGSYYQDNGTDCWWNYPNQETFQGYTSTGTGTFTQTPWGSCPAPTGQFLYNHTYRITRGVWNDQCPVKYFSMIITPARSADGHTMIAYEDLNAPDFSQAASINTVSKDELSIFPNPSNGLFTIELASSENTNFEIYNILGKKVKSVQQTGAKTTLDLSDFPKGIYFVNILSNGSQITKKVIIE